MAGDNNPEQGMIPDALSDITNAVTTHHSFDVDPLTWARWGIIVLIALGVTFWHQHQNKTFHEYIRNKNKRTPISDRLSQLAYNRSFEVLILFFLLILAVVFYDTRLQSSQERLAVAQTQIADMEAQAIVYEEQLARMEQELQEAIRLTGMDEAQQQELDQLKQEFEGLFISYYTLKQCGLNSTQDFHIMNSALMYRLNELNAPAGVRRNILDAANGSFEELYANQECESAELAAMQDGIRSYLRNVVQNLPDR